MRMMRTVAWPEEVEVAVTSPVSRRPVAATRRPTIAWVSLDPRSGKISTYPLEVAKHIEAYWQMDKENIYLGAAFFDARVCFRSAHTGQPFQRTPGGLRDVRRLEIEPGNE